MLHGNHSGPRVEVRLPARAKGTFLASRWRDLGASLLALVLAAPAANLFSPTDLQRHVEILANPAMEGRALGSKGASRAASYIEERFREFGLQPPPGLGWRQTFPVGLDLTFEESASRNAFTIAGPASQTVLTLRRDYQPLPFSANAAISDRRMVFAGYAISAPELDYDDFAGIDIRGKVVIAFRREPQERDGESRFQGLDFTRHASFAAKAKAVASRGGVALMLVSNRLPEEANDEIPVFSASTGPLKLPIPVVLVKAQAMAPYFTEQGDDLSALVRTIDRDSRPASFAFPDAYRVGLRVSLKGKSSEGMNVLGWKAGQTNEYVVVGAHYDHIGFGKRFSMEPGDRGQIHPGADDNASGVASMLELARTVANGPTMRRGVLFVAFGGEEHGLFGSSALLEGQSGELGTLAGMINFDMVGRLRDNELFVAGLESVPALAAPAETAALAAGLRLERIRDYPYNMSDHGNFLEAGVPAVLLFTGLHMEYHTARDTPGRINSAGATLVLEVAYAMLQEMATRPDRLEYVTGKDPAYQRNLREMAVPSNPLAQE